MFPSYFAVAYRSLQNKIVLATFALVCRAGSQGKSTNRSRRAHLKWEQIEWQHRAHHILPPQSFLLLGHLCRHSAPSSPPRNLVKYSLLQAGILDTSKGYQIQIR